MKDNHAKLVNYLSAQGDVLFERVDSLPADAVPVPRAGDIVVAHSETGHHHCVADKAVTEFRIPGNSFECYLRFDGPLEGGGADVVHRRSWSTHGTHRLLGEPGAVWKVYRQGEWSPWGDRMVAD